MHLLIVLTIAAGEFTPVIWTFNMRRPMQTSRKFWSTEQGGVTIPFTLLIPVVIFLLGLSIDYSNALRVRSALQTDADSAVLAAASLLGGSDGQAIAVAEKYFDTALSARGLAEEKVTRTISRDSGSGDYQADVHYAVKTRFAGFAGINNFNVSVLASAAPADGTRVLDIAMCIDATGSMQPVLDAVTANAMAMFTQLNSEFASRNLPEFDAVRARPIFFRDFGGNARWYSVARGGRVDKFPHGFVPRPAGDARNLGDDVPMRAAGDFYNLIDKSADLHTFVMTEVESGGGDYTESGLECLNEAMNSRWTHVGDRVKTATGNKSATDVFSVIAIWTDQNAQVPSFGPSLQNPNYPPVSEMPRNYAGLTAKWNDGNVIPQANKLLAMFVPNAAPTSGWDPVMAWDRYMHAGTLTDGTSQMVDRLADVVATVIATSGKVRLTN